MRTALLIAALLSWPAGDFVHAQTRQVCLEDLAGLNEPALGSLYREFQTLAGPRGLMLTNSGCEAGSVRLSLRRRGNGHGPDVLGAAYRQGGSIAPHLEIYVDAVVDLMPARCWDVVGRALGRVAAHEVAHFLDQDERHAEAGLLQARFSGSELAGDDSYPFRWIRSAR